MATNDFLPFAGGAGANVLTQADYEALAAVVNGFGSGILLSENLNKVLRQGTVMAAVLAQWIADNSGDNVVDDGSTSAIEASFTKALQLLGLRAASTTQTGVVQLATSAEAQALTDALKAITPGTLKGAFQGANQSLVTSGYQKLPGGLILQWGAGVTASNGSAAITFPIAFPNAALNYWGNIRGAPSVTSVYVSSGTAFTTTGGTFWINSATANQSFNWAAIGY